MSKTIIKSFIFTTAMLIPSFALKADDPADELRSLARSINDEAYELRRDVDTLINDGDSETFRSSNAIWMPLSDSSP